MLAAAVVARAHITRNLRHFPTNGLDLYEIEARHPDKFVRHSIDLAPVAVASRQHE